jgi:hypothetical protein
MSTTTERTSRHTAVDRRRMKALRWLLNLAVANTLPMPTRIDFREYPSPVRRATVRYLTVELDNDTDLTGWADAIGATEVDDLAVTGDTHTWTYRRACTPWRHGVRVDWHCIEVNSSHNRRPVTEPAAVTL